MKKSLFSFNLPSNLIAQKPHVVRDGARLLVVDCLNKTLVHSRVCDLPNIIACNTVCVPNNVRVRKARLLLRKDSGGHGEALILRQLPYHGHFEALVRPGSSLRPGKSVTVVDIFDNPKATLTIESIMPNGTRCVSIVNASGALNWDLIDSIGYIPLPRYISRLPDQMDNDRYQTVFNSNYGEAVAAPTSGLHFTQELIQGLIVKKKCIWAPICLHVGIGTFRPINVDNIDEHIIHKERYEISEFTADILEKTICSRQQQIMAIGTTSLRTIEFAWNDGKILRAGVTDLFIKPGYRIQVADSLLTNFHLPESTLFVLIASILGIEFAHQVYSIAIKEEYRFFSYGDAMLINNIR